VNATSTGYEPGVVIQRTARLLTRWCYVDGYLCEPK
jgi:hypothetical protein